MSTTRNYFVLFEGGGAKGVAYAGALRACEKYGIRFEGACGVSAGSIAATFVAAQIPPREVASLLVQPIAKILKAGQGNCVRRSLSAFGRFITLRGLRTSAGIEHWVEAQLQKALGLNRPVCFQDLRRPLAILAYDSTNGEPKVWSTFRTGEARVATAVRASCSIPFAFSPTPSGDSDYVDGGVLDNLPLFLLDELSQHTELPAIAFRLKNSDRIFEPSASSSPLSKGLQTIGRTIDARAELSRLGYLDVRNVEIDCGNVTTTNFDLTPIAIRALNKSGREAVRNCLKNIELSRGAAGVDKQLQAEDLRRSKRRHATLAKTGRIIDQARTSISILAGDISWLEQLAPYLLIAKRRNVGIRLLTGKASQANIECARRLGIRVRILNSDEHLRATIVDACHAYGQAVIVEKDNATSPITFYASEAPRLLIHLAHDFEGLWNGGTERAEFEPQVRRLEFDEVAHVLGKVSQYSGSKISIENLTAHDVLPACAYVETFKLDRLEHVQMIYDDLSSCVGYHIVGTPWYSIWPVVERRPGGSLVVIDGTHRFYSAFVRKRSVACLIVDCSEDLPSRPMRDWNEVRISTAKLERHVRYDMFEQKRFRHIKEILSEHFVAH